MTNEEAIEMLEYIRRTGNGESAYKNDAQSIALDMAIQALEQELSRDMEEIMEIINCDADAEIKCKMISNILTAKPHYFEEQKVKALEQPQCNTCKHNNKKWEDEPCDGCCGNRNYEPIYYPQVEGITPTVVKPHDGDLISRQALQEWIKDKSFGDIVVASEHNFDCLPPVKPQEKTGHWIPKNSFLLKYKCSECNCESERYNFCPNCGARMIEPQESEDK